MVDLKDIVRPNIWKLTPYSSARDEFTGEDGTFLDANENPYGELNRYPDPYQKGLKKKLMALKNISETQIFIGNGSDEVIDLAFRIFCTPGQDKAITFSPTYGMYEVSSSINNVELIQLPLNQEFQIDIKSLEPYFNQSRIKLMFICSPNNPTGNVMNRSDIEYILNNFKGIVVVDEAYIDFSETKSLISLISQYNNLIVSQTFSKAWGLAAARVGTAYASTEIIKLYNKIKPPYNISKINQQEAIKALNNLASFKHNMALVLEEKERLKNALKAIKLIKTIHPSDTNFLLIEVDDANQLYKQLVNMKIITRNRNTLVSNCLRITVGTPQENDKLLNALKTLS